jgi:hypothetical protein
MAFKKICSFFDKIMIFPILDEIETKIVAEIIFFPRALKSSFFGLMQFFCIQSKISKKMGPQI